MISTLALPALGLIIGLWLLIKSADAFIEGAAAVAAHMNISPLIIGVVVLGFGTSMPEIIVSILAALDGAPGLAVGNAIGSNIANIGLVLGATALLVPLGVRSSVLRRELPLLIGVTVAAGLLFLDGRLSRFDGVMLLVAFFASMAWMIHINRAAPASDPLEQEMEQELATLEKMPLKKAWLMTLGGLIVLMLAAKLMVWGAVEIAHHFGVSDAVIGLTIIAIGTSLPELAAGITAARKGEADLVVGNVVGSNLFNLLTVVAMPALIAPGALDAGIVTRDYPIMLAFTLLMLLFALPLWRGPARISRIEGSLLSAGFAAYLVLLYFSGAAT
ncbi:calcium/sodium antiporter [Sulfurivirga sp.]|uniref:calcium/sodium antiporter n=1 Tax=Sulfurivirga sp. TaxID=2614236 RepID=UPI0025EDC4F5|nr:calcium/sodium antiporter [Sulfurivirga sp.]